jgi:hypothetical protein
MEKDTREGVFVIFVGLVWAALWVLDALYWKVGADPVANLIVLLLVAYAIVEATRRLSAVVLRHFFK